MASELTEFLRELQSIVRLEASEEGSETGSSEAFTRYMVDVLTEAGEIDDAELASYSGSGARASGFSVSEDESTLWLLLSDYRGALDIQTLGKTDLTAHVRRMLKFLERSRDGLWRKLEESSAAWDMAQRIDLVWDHVSEIRLVILTNAELRSSLPKPSKLDGRALICSVWDLDRLHKLSISGRAQEPIDIDIIESWGDTLPCLGPRGEPGAYDSYLLMLPGEFIASIYEQHGPRLLELNVRSFLQSRGKVNRGIQETIKTEPGRFLAYNNGISMTASAVEVSSGQISRIHDLQIVNGGQTTASLHYAKSKGKVDLSDVFVQAKLSVVDADHLMSLVPKISEFANSQNKVNMADFSANDPFHVEIERLSRSVWSPGQLGTTAMTHWFYERARGQYADAHVRARTPAKQREFKAINPPSQKFTKTDLAKFENTWDQLPWVVSLGAEKNFREFMLRLSARGAKFTPDVAYFEQLVAKAILFKRTEKIVGSLQLGGYRSQTVTYTIAKLLYTTQQRIDLHALWRLQGLPLELAGEIERLAPTIHSELVRTAGTKNVGEWCKKEDCWKAIRALDWDVPRGVDGVQTDHSESAMPGARYITSIEHRLTPSESADAATVAGVGPETWFRLSKWAKETGTLQGWQRGLAYSLGQTLGRGGAPTPKQVTQGALILSEATRLGFRAE